MAAEEAAQLADEARRVVVPDDAPAGRRSPALVEFDPTTTPPRTPSGSARRSPAIRTAPSRRPPATTPRAASAAATPSASSASEIVAWGGAGSTLAETVARARRRTPRSSP